MMSHERRPRAQDAESNHEPFLVRSCASSAYPGFLPAPGRLIVYRSATSFPADLFELAVDNDHWNGRVAV